MVGFSEHRRVTDPSRQGDHLVGQSRRVAKIGAHVIDVSETSYRGEEFPVVVQLSAQLLGALIDNLRFARCKSLRSQDRTTERQLQGQLQLRARLTRRKRCEALESRP